MKVLVCCILKMENHYLEEWLQHYINLGFDKVVIYDNNDITGDYAERIEDLPLVKEHIDNKFIDVYKIPGEECVQLMYYNECYKQYSNYDWLLFVDIDEFLILENHNNIKEFLSDEKFDKFDIIHINWKTFTDNELLTVKNNDYSLMSRFTTPCKEVNGILKRVDKEVKSFVRGGIKNLKFSKNPHTLDSIEVPCCNVLGKQEKNSWQKNQIVVHEVAWINHYICKTVEEYCKTKLIRLGGHTSHKRNLRYNDLFFFTYNKKTPEKIKLLEQYFPNIKRKRHVVCTVPRKNVQQASYVGGFNQNSSVKKITILKHPNTIKTLRYNLYE